MNEKERFDLEKEILKKAIPLAVGVSLVISLIIGATLSFAGNSIANVHWQSFFHAQNQPSENSTEKVRVVSEESAVIDAVKNSAPAVVSIIASEDVPVIERYYEQVTPFQGMDMFKDFTFTVPRYRQNGTETKRVGAGTGFIVSSEGYILTNKHVVSNLKAEYTVITTDQTKYSGQVLARDPVSDIAILKITSEKPLVFLEFGDSDSLMSGQTVIAIGYALGLFDNSVSKGVISGLSRTIDAYSGSGIQQTSEHLEGIIQTDAAINFGNSGGPLLNIDGQVIGMNVAIQQGSQNIGFALPINEVRKVYESVKTNGRIVRPQLGLRYVLINDDVQKELKLNYNYGALVTHGEKVEELAVIPGSSADIAGIVEGDIILAVDGQNVDVTHSISYLLREKSVGDIIILKVSTSGNERDVSVTLTEMQL